jgi:hypothetical protein
VGSHGWRKSSHSGMADCVEVAPAPSGVQLRNSNDPDGRCLSASRRVFGTFLDGVRGGDLDA